MVHEYDEFNPEELATHKLPKESVAAQGKRQSCNYNRNILPEVWIIMQKDIATHKVYKLKARSNLHSGKQEKVIFIGKHMPQ